MVQEIRLKRTDLISILQQAGRNEI